MKAKLMGLLMASVLIVSAFSLVALADRRGGDRIRLDRAIITADGRILPEVRVDQDALLTNALLNGRLLNNAGILGINGLNNGLVVRDGRILTTGLTGNGVLPGTVLVDIGRSGSNSGRG